ncbi:MAG: NUDIX domain-containing protein [Candidatus Paceibacterota bacterium]
MNTLCSYKREDAVPPPGAMENDYPSRASSIICFHFIEGRLCVKAVLQRRREKENKWGLPGGKRQMIRVRERWESPIENAIRETKEETGYVFPPEALYELPVYEKVDEYGMPYNHHLFVGMFASVSAHDKKLVFMEEIAKQDWFDVLSVITQEDRRMLSYHARHVAVALRAVFEAKMDSLPRDMVREFASEIKHSLSSKEEREKKTEYIKSLGEVWEKDEYITSLERIAPSDF